MVPLGDLHPRRLLVPLVFLVPAAALVACAVAPDPGHLRGRLVVAGAASVAGQIMIPFAADLAAPERRGRVVARIMTGLLAGDPAGPDGRGTGRQRRGMAGHLLDLGRRHGAVRGRARPGPAEGDRPPPGPLPVSGGRIGAPPGREPVLRRRALHGACMFAAFSVLWTPLAFLLSAPPYRYSSAVIGLFGLVAWPVSSPPTSPVGSWPTRRADLATPAAAAGLAAFGLLSLGSSVRRPAGGRDRPARPGRSGDADHQSGGDLRPPTRRPEPYHERLHVLLLRGRCGRIRAGRGRLRPGRVGRRLHHRQALAGLGSVVMWVFDRWRPAKPSRIVPSVSLGPA